MIAAMVAAPLMASPPALAQWLGDAPMPPQAIARILMRQGFTGFTPPRLTGDVYVVQAVTEDGERVRVVIDALDGRILRPVRAEELAPGRPLDRLSPDRLSPRDRLPLPEYEVEPIERFRAPRTGRDEVLLPPRSIGPEPFEGRRSRESEYEIEREPIEPYRGPPAGREPSLPTVRNEPLPTGRAARIEQPAPERLAPSPGPREPERPREADRPREASRPRPATAPAPTVAAPTIAAPKPDRPADLKPIEVKPADIKPAETKPAETKPADPKPATTAAVPAAPAPVPTAPASAPKKPEASATAAAPAPQPPAAQPPLAQPAPSTSGPPPKVRVIEGVTPVIPQDPASAEKK